MNRDAVVMSARPSVWPGAEPPAMSVAPPALLVAGQPCVGRHAGCLPEVRLDQLPEPWARPAWWRRFHHKRWQYVGMGSADVFVGLAIVDLGWAGTAFVYVFDRLRRRMLVDWSADGLPGWSAQVSDRPVQGLQARFRGRGAQIDLGQEGQQIQVSVRLEDLQLQASLSLPDRPPFLLAVGPVEGGSLHTTHKSAGLPVTGWLECQGQRMSLDQAVAAVDASNGLLPRRTQWRWACAHDLHMGFNLQSGYFGDQENVLWLDGQLVPLGTARFEFDARNPLTEWRVQTDDDLLDLRFRPEGARSDQRHWGVVASRYVQPVGTFHGRVRAHRGEPWRLVEHLVGVTEDHDSLW